MLINGKVNIEILEPKATKTQHNRNGTRIILRPKEMGEREREKG